jgi:hypothetical protein
MAKEPTLTKVSRDKQKEIPAAKAPGFETYPVVCKQYNPIPGIGAGLMYVSPGAEDRTWEDFPIWDILFCEAGEMVIEETDDNGETVTEVRAQPGEYVVLAPEGRNYTFKSSGEPTTILFVNIRDSDESWDITGSYGDEYGEAMSQLD